MARHTRVNRAACAAAASDPALLATDLADYLVRNGIPFRKAHKLVGAVVALAEKKRKPLDRLSIAEMQSVDSAFDRGALRVFDLDKAMMRRNFTGAPGTLQVRNQLTAWRRKLDGA